jgi:translocation and assembly module TamB
LPLKIVDVLLAARGTKGTGYLHGDVIITGPAKNPEFNGTATISGGGIRDVDSGLQLANLQLAARISGKEFIVDRLEAAAVPEGRVAASGRIGLDTAAGFPVNVDARADGVKLQDRKTIAGRFDSRVRITGGLDRGLMVAGSVSLQRFDIAIPERLPRSISDLNVTHVNVPPERRKELGLAVQPKDRSAMTPIRLDLDIRSDGRIFVRGRGLDAQLGGGIRLTGLTSQPVAEGAFRMVRGRMAIVGRRLAFNRGTIGFAGSLDPSLDFEATSDADGTVITTTVSGYASNPIIKFTSTPQLPEDELLARLLFNKSLAKLSPLQIAQLASEVDRLGGISGGSGVLEQLRKSVGVDSLDVSSDKKGNTAITAGKYVTQGTYVGVQQNTGTNASRVIIDLDITNNIKARGETGSDGKSKVGVGIEWNY